MAKGMVRMVIVARYHDPKGLEGLKNIRSPQWRPDGPL